MIMTHSPWISEKTRCKSHPKSYNFHALQWKKLAEWLKELWLPTIVGEEVTLVPESCVMGE